MDERGSLVRSDSDVEQQERDPSCCHSIRSGRERELRSPSKPRNDKHKEFSSLSAGLDSFGAMRHEAVGSGRELHSQSSFVVHYSKRRRGARESPILKPACTALLLAEIQTGLVNAPQTRRMYMLLPAGMSGKHVQVLAKGY
jgi:hypothetical protein